MWNYIWPILLVIGSNTVYNICAKSTPAEANSFVSLSITYLVGARPAAAQYINVHALQKGVHVPPCCIFGLNSMSTARCSSCIRKQIS